MRKLLLFVAVFGIAFIFLMLGPLHGKSTVQPAGAGKEGYDKLLRATFAGGCFWCVEADFEKLDGVVRAVSGYTGGQVENPTYEEVSAGGTGHLEAVQVTYDPNRVNYKSLVEFFWEHIDPTDAGGQFVDRGAQYRSAIFYHDDEQRRLAEESRSELEKSGRFEKPIVTEIIRFSKFYPAEEYHQEYSRKNPIRYTYYRFHSGRDQFLKKVWADMKTKTEAVSQGTYSKPGDEQLRKILSSLQYKVTQENGTEPPFKNDYWDNKKAGIYVDIVSGEPLFSSLDKFDSGTGWPSFTKPLESWNVVERQDRSLLFMTRTEVRSKHGDSHLGHVFPDGPAPTGLRYCMNSASLRFIPSEELAKEGYGHYSSLFDSRGPEEKAAK